MLAPHVRVHVHKMLEFSVAIVLFLIFVSLFSLCFFLCSSVWHRLKSTLIQLNATMTSDDVDDDNVRMRGMKMMMIKCIVDDAWQLTDSIALSASLISCSCSLFLLCCQLTFVIAITTTQL